MPSITSLGVGSGLDLNGLLDQLERGERQRLVPINDQKKGVESKISAYGAIMSAATRLQDAVRALSEVETFHAVETHVLGNAVSARIDGTATTGDYQITVSQLAQRASVATTGVADRSASLGVDSLTIELADASQLNIALDPAHSSLEDIRDAINAQDGPVRATLINDGSGSPWRLSLSAAETGAQADIESITFSGAGAPGAPQIDEGTRLVGQDALLNVNGVEITSPSNRVEGAIEGVVLDLTELGSATLQIGRNDEAVTSAVEDFVKSYNELNSTLRGLSSYDAGSGQAGPLLGDSAARGLRSELRSTVGQLIGDAGDPLRMLADLGVNQTLDGSLELDGDAFADALRSGAADVQRFFVGESGQPGLAGRLGEVLERATGSDGMIHSATDSLNGRMQTLDRQVDRVQQQIDRTIERYRTQFQQLDALIAGMNSTSEYLAQQLDMLGNLAMGGNK